MNNDGVIRHNIYLGMLMQLRYPCICYSQSVKSDILEIMYLAKLPTIEIYW